MQLRVARAQQGACLQAKDSLTPGAGCAVGCKDQSERPHVGEEGALRHPSCDRDDMAEMASKRNAWKQITFRQVWGDKQRVIVRIKHLSGKHHVGGWLTRHPGKLTAAF